LILIRAPELNVRVAEEQRVQKLSAVAVSFFRKPTLQNCRRQRVNQSNPTAQSSGHLADRITALNIAVKRAAMVRNGAYMHNVFMYANNSRSHNSRQGI